MGTLFSLCKDDNKPSEDDELSVRTPPLYFERDGKQYVVMNNQSFTEI